MTFKFYLNSIMNFFNCIKNILIFNLKDFNLKFEICKVLGL